jgi:hypothetical protein
MKTSFAWQGIRMTISTRWHPLELEGTFSSGYALLVDLHGPRMAIRWATPRGKTIKPIERIRKAMLQEVGRLAAEEARILTTPEMECGLLYTEAALPGRDVWIGWSPTSGRMIQIIYHAHRRDRILEKLILPTLVDEATQATVPWAVFDLNCRIPREYRLGSRQLNAGDLNLWFESGNQRLRVRQIAMADLALKRRPLAMWLQADQRLQSRNYRPKGDTVAISAQKSLGTLRRRRRFFFAWKLPRTLTTIAHHDVPRDRLIIVQGSNPSTVMQATDSMNSHTERS